MTGDGPAAGAQPVRAVPVRAAGGLAGLGGGGDAGGLAADAGRGAGAGLADVVRHAAAHVASASTPTARTLLLAVLEKRVGLELLGDDVFVSVAGGLEVAEPAVDLGGGGRGGVVVPQPAGARAHRALRRGRPGGRGARRRPGRACASARRRRWASTRCILPARNLPPDARTASGWSASRTLEEALERPRRAAGSPSGGRRRYHWRRCRAFIDCMPVPCASVGIGLEVLVCGSASSGSSSSPARALRVRLLARSPGSPGWGSLLGARRRRRASSPSSASSAPSPATTWSGALIGGVIGLARRAAGLGRAVRPRHRRASTSSTRCWWCSSATWGS